MTPQEPQDGAERLSAALDTLAGLAASGARCGVAAGHVREIAAELHGMAQRMGEAVPVAPGITRVWRAGGTRRRDDGLTIPEPPVAWEKWRERT